MMDATLTIGIPTYNRKAAITANVNALLQQRVAELDGIEVLVSDNHSDDGAFEAVQEISAGTTIRVLRNDSNVGVVRNIIRLLTECRTEYLLITSDEDHVIAENIQPLRTYLAEKQASFVSPRYDLNGRLYRGRKKSAEIDPADWARAAFYISGVVYRVADARAVIERLGEFVFHPDQLYFQNLVVAELMMSGGCYWWDRPIVRNHVRMPTTINANRKGGAYQRLPSRWMQYLETDRYLTDLVSRYLNSPEASVAEAMQSSFRRGFIHTIRHAIRYEAPHLLAEFDVGVRHATYRALFTSNRAMRVVSRMLRFLGRMVGATMK